MGVVQRAISGFSGGLIDSSCLWRPCRARLPLVHGVPGRLVMGAVLRPVYYLPSGRWKFGWTPGREVEESTVTQETNRTTRERHHSGLWRAW